LPILGVDWPVQRRERARASLALRRKSRNANHKLTDFMRRLVSCVSPVFTQGDESTRERAAQLCLAAANVRAKGRAQPRDTFVPVPGRQAPPRAPIPHSSARCKTSPRLAVQCPVFPCACFLLVPDGLISARPAN